MPPPLPAPISLSATADGSNPDRARAASQAEHLTHYRSRSISAARKGSKALLGRKASKASRAQAAAAAAATAPAAASSSRNMSAYLRMDHTTTGGKFGTGGSVGDQWQRRWFVLHNDAIEYHETEQDSAAGNRPLGILEFDAGVSLRTILAISANIL